MRFCIINRRHKTLNLFFSLYLKKFLKIFPGDILVGVCGDDTAVVMLLWSCGEGDGDAFGVANVSVGEAFDEATVAGDDTGDSVAAAEAVLVTGLI